MPWVLKGLFVLVKTRRGRRLLVAAGLGAADLVRSDQARKLYARARAKVTDLAARQNLTRV